MVEFSFGMPVGKEYFYNRKEELERLLDRLEKIKNNLRNDMAIIGPRRVGKSSLTNKLSEELRKKGITAVQIDCEGLTLPVFLKEYGNAIIKEEIKEKGLGEKFSESVKQGVSATITALSEILGRIKALEVKSNFADFLSLRIEIEKTPESELKGTRLYDFFSKTIELPEELGKKYAIIMDEFQETSTYGILKKNDFHALFRRIIQKQKNTCYVYTGSSIGMMDEIFGNPNSPLAGNADILNVGPFDEETSKQFIKNGIENHNKKIEETGIALLFEKSGGFPAYLNWLGLKFLDSKEKVITKKEVEETINNMLSPTSAVYQIISKQLIRLGAKTKVILTIIARGRLEAPGIAKESGTKNAYVYLNRLQNYGLVKKEGNKFYLIDPIIAEGLRRGTFN